jgi:hypothetical protein
MMTESGRVLTYVSGVLYFYGVMDFELLYKTVNQMIPSMPQREEFKRLLDEAAEDEGNPYAFEEWQGCYCDYAVEDPAWVLAEQQRRGGLRYRPVTEEEAQAILADRYAAVWNEGESLFFDWLRDNSGADGDLALGLLLDYEDCLRNDLPLLDLTMMVVQALNIRLEDMEDTAAVIAAFAEHVPLWILKGWSPEEVRARYTEH